MTWSLATELRPCALGFTPAELHITRIHNLRSSCTLDNGTTSFPEVNQSLPFSLSDEYNLATSFAKIDPLLRGTVYREGYYEWERALLLPAISTPATRVLPR